MTHYERIRNVLTYPDSPWAWALGALLGAIVGFLLAGLL